MSLTINLNQAQDVIVEAIKAKLVPLVWGSPAVGKSAIVKQVADAYGLKLIDLRLAQCDPVDLMGFPRIDEATGKADYAPMATFPLKGDPIPEGYNGWLLFLDELTSAPRAVQAASYKILLDRQVGLHDLHDNVAVVAAGNLETDNAIVEPMSTALQSRLVHVEVSMDHNVWLEWAMANGIDHRITSYIQFKPDSLYTFHPDHTDKTYASPRTWEFASRMTGDIQELTYQQMPLLAGTLSEGVAREYLQFTKVYQDVPTIAQIKQSPDTTPIPDEPSVLYALTGSVAAHSDETNIAQVFPYINRMPKEFQVVCLREVVRRNNAMLKVKPVLDWAMQNSTELM